MDRVIIENLDMVLGLVIKFLCLIALVFVIFVSFKIYRMISAPVSLQPAQKAFFNSMGFMKRLLFGTNNCDVASNY